MKHRQLIFGVITVMFAFELQLMSAQTQPCPAADKHQPAQRERLESLLKQESEALSHLQELVPAIGCQYADRTVSENCQSFVLNLKDEANEASSDIAKYRSERSPKPEELFDIYVRSEWILNQIGTLLEIDEFNGHRYQKPLADAYNHFIKLTGAWFKGEMREVISKVGQGCC